MSALSPRLANGDAFPSVTALDADGNTTSIGSLTEGRWSVVLFYRGHW